MDKFIVKKSINTDGYKPVMLDAPTHEKLMELKQLTGVPIKQLVDQMVDFCAERLHLEE